MEPLWSPVVANSGNRWQIERPRKRLEYAKTVAVDCDRLPRKAMVRRGSTASPSEGLKFLHPGNFYRLFRPDTGKPYGGGRPDGDAGAVHLRSAKRPAAREL